MGFSFVYRALFTSLGVLPWAQSVLIVQIEIRHLHCVHLSAHMLLHCRKVDAGRRRKEASHERLRPRPTCTASLGPVKDMPHQSDRQEHITHACRQTSYTAFAVKGSIPLSQSWHRHKAAWYVPEVFGYSHVEKQQAKSKQCEAFNPARLPLLHRSFDATSSATF
jgi:hypothetical protein